MNLAAVFNSFPVLETEHLVLRAFTLEDTPAVFSLFSEEDVTRQTDVETFQNMADAEQLVQEFIREYEERKAIRWVIMLKENDLFAGECGFNFFDTRNRRAEIGYHLMRPYWGKGIMTETVAAMITFGFETVGLNRIEADTMLWNVGSMKLLHKLGFREEGIARERGCWKGQFHDLRLFALLKSDFTSHV